MCLSAESRVTSNHRGSPVHCSQMGYNMKVLFLIVYGADKTVIFISYFHAVLAFFVCLSIMSNHVINQTDSMYYMGYPEFKNTVVHLCIAIKSRPCIMV